MYKAFLRPVLFLVDPEKIHHFVFSFLKWSGKVPGIKSLLRLLYCYEDKRLEKKILGITFRNPVGLAAGFDKDAMLIDEAACLGFGFIEIGTLTPKPQPGNEKPRLFRLPSDQALINRMGFNNRGAVEAAQRLRTRKSSVVVGGNIGKNKLTENENAIDDYRSCLDSLYEHVDYFVVNVSSPNTPGLRALQEKEPLRKLLANVKALSLSKPKPRPVLLKIAPDLTNEQLDDVIGIIKETATDGIIATNTTISREGLVTDKNILESIGSGGLSGKPLSARATDVIRYLRTGLGPQFPIIGVGGIMNEADALDKLRAGADLIQLYTGFIYEGPAIIKRINKAILGYKV
jgi:dihydroorotate dehydrogenase